MAGFSTIYCLGGLGGFRGSDGINLIAAQIWKGDGNVQWMEAHYFADDLQPYGQVEQFIPRGPDDENALLDAAILFFHNQFSLTLPATLEMEIGDQTTVDISQFDDVLMKELNRLREEARPEFYTLNLFKAELQPMF
jgi:hypothetical protein